MIEAYAKSKIYALYDIFAIITNSNNNLIMESILQQFLSSQIINIDEDDKGGAGQLTFKTLVQAMLEDYGDSTELLIVAKKLVIEKILAMIN